MSKKKKEIRSHFRNACYQRDGYQCAMCGAKPPEDMPVEDFLDAHHITDRTEMPNGGYVPENGISLCSECHVIAEEFHVKGQTRPSYMPAALYKKIGSSHEKAVRASKKLGDELT